MTRATARSADGPQRNAAADLPSGSTRERLLLATERLVAEHGVDGVSTRQISSEAGTDLGSIHHHFGSKDQLMLAARERRVGMIEAALQALIAARRAEGGEITPRDLAVFIVKPFADLAVDGASEARHYPAFLRSLTQCRRLSAQLAVDTRWTRRLLELFAEVRPDLVPDERRRRLALTSAMTINAVGDGALNFWLETTTPGLEHRLIGSLLDCVAAALAAP
jgi:AcrR family transcriptional regulator